MTDRIIVATFDNTNAAYDAGSAIKDQKMPVPRNLNLRPGS